MKAARYLALLIILLIFFACKGKPESCETSVQSDQVSAQTISPEAVETQETKTEPQAAATKANPKPEVKATPVAEPEPVKPKSDQVYFLEIGSVNCIPCQMMQPIMKEIAEEYAGIVKVEFYNLQVDRRAQNQDSV